MNELIEYEQTPSLPSIYSDLTLYEQFYKVAESLSKTDLVPDNYKNKPENCLIAIDTARQIGCKNPLFVMQNLTIVKGKPSWSGQYCSAIVKANFKNDRVKWYGLDSENSDDIGCRVFATDKNGNECMGTKITIKMAKDEGWYSKKDKFGKECSKWQTMPEQMLQYRAYAFFARVHCPDKLLGLHDEYENEDILRTTDNSSAKSLEEKLIDLKKINNLNDIQTDDVLPNKEESIS